MITEDYVSFEVAKNLKEKGFNCEKQYISAMYDENGYFCPMLTTSELGGYDYEDFDDKDFIAPTLQMAMKWLRMKKNLFIQIFLLSDCGYWYNIDEILDDSYNHKSIYSTGRDDVYYSSFEQACEAAIKYCLENLI